MNSTERKLQIIRVVRDLVFLATTGLSLYSRRPEIAYPTGDWLVARWFILAVFVGGFSFLALIVGELILARQLPKEKRTGLASLVP